MQQLPSALAAFAPYHQFIVCRAEPDPAKPGKTLKHPISIHDGSIHNAHDPSIWIDHATACACVAAWGAPYHVGFVFTKADPLWFIDVDNCLTPEGQWTPIVDELCAQLPGAAVEISQSGRGLHIFGTGQAPEDRRKKDHTNKLFDLYTEGRFALLTGTAIQGDAATVHTAALHAITAKHLARDTVDGKPATWTTAPVPEWNGPKDDADLIARARRSTSSRAAFGDGVCFADLWDRNVEALAKRYKPDGNGTEAFGESEADRALAQHLAFWTGKDCARIERLMRQSALVRPKWHEHQTYLCELTIMGAVAVQSVVCIDKPIIAEPWVGEAAPTKAAEPVRSDTQGIVGADSQIDIFKGCVYVCDQHKILAPGGILHKPDQFRVIYGGRTYYVEDQRSTRDAWEAFSQSQLIRTPRADSTCFRPELPAASLVDYDGQTRANMWWPIVTPRKVGDPSPFLNHLAALLPDERDRKILLSYMAAVVQYKGYKFQWCPVIVGAEGNGKTMLTRCVAFAVGDRYSYLPKASQIAGQFNDWQYGTIFAGVEDIYVGDQSGRADVMEELKPMVTGDQNEIEGKGEKKIKRELCFNLMLNSNHDDCIRKNRNDRRFAMFHTAQKTVEDIVEWGMSGDYFPRLYSWLRAEGYAIVNELLHTYQIEPEFNPCVQMGGLAQRAPMTTSFDAAITASLGPVEQEIQEAVDQALPGFAGGWISSIAFGELLEKIGRANRVSQNKRRDMLAALGYDWHPGLLNGRVNSNVAPDGGKPRLFVKHDHPMRHLTNAADIARAYSADQMAHVRFGVPG